MAYGYRNVSHSELGHIVERLSTPTQSSRSWRYDYDAQEENLRYLKRHDPAVHRECSATPARLRTIVGRLTKPTVASISQRWNYDCEDGNLMFLKKFDPNIRLPYRTVNQRESDPPQPGAKVSVADLSSFLDHRSVRPPSRQQTTHHYSARPATRGGGGGNGEQEAPAQDTIVRVCIS